MPLRILAVVARRRGCAAPALSWLLQQRRGISTCLASSVSSNRCVCVWLQGKGALSRHGVCVCVLATERGAACYDRDTAEARTELYKGGIA